MSLRPKAIEIPANQPFTYDLLGRGKIAESLTELIQFESEGFVLALDAPWGQGKTTFLQMWQKHLINKNFRTLYFNAWETDFANDALVALIGELEHGIGEMQDKPTGTQGEQLVASVQKLKLFGSKLIRRSIPVAVKVATAGLLELDDFSEEALADYAEKLAEDKLKAYEDSRKSIKTFQKTIGDVAKSIAKHDESGQSLPLVIIVDELDRCRPNYSIQVLECIKHLFVVPGVFFVLALDRTQLAHSIRSQYGVGMDATGYLRRFFDLEFSLPEPNLQLFTNTLFKRFGLVDYFVERANTYSDSQSDKFNLEEIFPQLFKCLECSLRDSERAFSLLSFAIRATPKNQRLFPDLLATLIVFKIKEPDIYTAFISKVSSPQSLLDRIASGPGGEEFINSHTGMLIEAFLYASISSRSDSTSLMSRYELVAQDTTKLAKQRRAKEILEILVLNEMRHVFGCLTYLLAKIDLASNLK